MKGPTFRDLEARVKDLEELGLAIPIPRETRTALRRIHRQSRSRAQFALALGNLIMQPKSLIARNPRAAAKVSLEAAKPSQQGRRFARFLNDTSERGFVSMTTDILFGRTSASELVLLNNGERVSGESALQLSKRSKQAASLTRLHANRILAWSISMLPQATYRRFCLTHGGDSPLAGDLHRFRMSVHSACATRVFLTLIDPQVLGFELPSVMKRSATPAAGSRWQLVDLEESIKKSPMAEALACLKVHLSSPLLSAAFPEICAVTLPEAIVRMSGTSTKVSSDVWSKASVLSGAEVVIYLMLKEFVEIANDLRLLEFDPSDAAGLLADLAHDICSSDRIVERCRPVIQAGGSALAPDEVEIDGSAVGSRPFLVGELAARLHDCLHATAREENWTRHRDPMRGAEPSEDYFDRRGELCAGHIDLVEDLSQAFCLSLRRGL